MGARNSRPRTQKDYIFATYNDKQYMLITGAFQTNAIIYYTRKKLLNGKLDIPFLENPKNLTTILITCSKEDGLKFQMI